MKRRMNSNTSVYSFLKSSGVLENGTHEQIQKARNEYWREYKRKWRKHQRKKNTEFAISFSQEELKELSTQAKRHKVSRTKFIKKACFAYINKSFIVPDIAEVRKISQLLSMTYNAIQESLESNKIEFKNGKDIMERVYQLEREILPVLNNPKSIELQ
ncbi:MAG: hypothetical protein IPI45_07015 [Saprospiraceae bacterium]|nr:hypothetical protein [Saprospiraceae bacterium]MBK7737511.1 hypothetical protein [Saprospiraceae bacterium]MBK7913906.1 hypothetical protein [Saprospiraceae bacterium]